MGKLKPFGDLKLERMQVLKLQGHQFAPYEHNTFLSLWRFTIGKKGLLPQLGINTGLPAAASLFASGLQEAPIFMYKASLLHPTLLKYPTKGRKGPRSVPVHVLKFIAR